MINIIAAVDDVGGIGRVGKLPWYIPEDLKRFKELTYGCTVIMGRKTFESLGNKPLRNRNNYVVTSRHIPLTERSDRWAELDGPGTSLNFFHSPIEALGYAMAGKKPIWIIGGAQIYEQLLDKADYLYFTHVDGKYDCDSFFPKYEDKFELVSKEYSKEVSCIYSIYKRKIP